MSWHETMLNKHKSISAVKKEMARRGALAEKRYLTGKSDKAREMARKRWDKYYADKLKETK